MSPCKGSSRGFVDFTSLAMNGHFPLSAFSENNVKKKKHFYAGEDQLTLILLNKLI